MRLTMLGTGKALVTNCYNTCFVLSEEDRRILVDGGGGNGIQRQLKAAGFDWKKMRHIIGEIPPRLVRVGTGVIVAVCALLAVCLWLVRIDGERLFSLIFRV